MIHQLSFDKTLEEIVEQLQIPISRYEAAEKSYKSVGEWLDRANSPLKQYNPSVYIQGSFALGTAIKPINRAEDYDIDLVCELEINKLDKTQFDLKSSLGKQIVEYAASKSMSVPEEGRRCWTLQYADGAQFHLDVLPAIPDGYSQRNLLEKLGLDARWTDTALAITDNTDPYYNRISNNWPHSNPKGFAQWFQTQMSEVFNSRRKAIALAEKASVDDIPKYRVKTPLQSIIQLLKFHRDQNFVDQPDHKPISIIITTLAAKAYEQETSLADTLFKILSSMENYIEDKQGVKWIPNPTDPQENFADKWQEYPEREKAFYNWLERAKTDFNNASQAPSRNQALDLLKSGLGSQLVEAVKKSDAGFSGGIVQSAASKLRILINPTHRKKEPWNISTQGEVSFNKATVSRPGFRPTSFTSDGAAIPKNCSLTFEAQTNVPKPYRIYWQITNTGREAERANCLRGDFTEGEISVGNLTRKESTLYSGKHSAECFIVKNGFLAARSGQFIVNIE